jgi:hypothetical protein|tara:strand:+ start:39 stop:857 length:819 start_codon:yes stop_codon:yes gene_type:complete
MAISISSIYKQELAAIEEEQKEQEAIYEKQKEASKMLGGGLLQAGSYAGKKGKEFSEKQLEESFQYIEDEHLRTAPKYTEFAPESGPGKDTLWSKTEEFLGLDFGGPGETGTIGYSEKYISSAIESGEGLKEFGIGPTAFDANIVPGTPEATKDIIGTVGEQSFNLGTSTLTKAADPVAGTAAEFTTELSTKGITAASKGSATATASTTAGSIAAGVGVATGGLQMVKGFSEGDVKDVGAGTLKAGGSALMFTPAAPIGLAMVGLGTLLDFV